MFEQGDCSSISGSVDSPTNEVEAKNLIRFLQQLLFFFFLGGNMETLAKILLETSRPLSLNG